MKRINLSTKQIRLLVYSSIIIVIATLFITAKVDMTQAQDANYISSDICAMCHPDVYDDWTASRHSKILLTAEEAQEEGIHPPPEEYTWDDILYTIGGKWKTQYVNTTGYIITDSSGEPGSNQWNDLTERWVDYNPGEKKPYDCGGCHTTGYSSEGNQDGIEGIVGTWTERNVACEACHGPGSNHLAGPSPETIVKDTSANVCGECHSRGEDEKIQASDGLIRHEAQYQEFIATGHNDLDCVTCHEPHMFTAQRMSCESCHANRAELFADTAMAYAGVKCIDCHMPRAVKSAEGDASTFYGDVRTHMVEINTDPAETLTYIDSDGEWGKGYITLGWACLTSGCHSSENIEFASENYMIAHQSPEPSPTPTPTPTPSPTPAEDGGRCIIATATYGSELSPEVQFLRGFRDNYVLNTFAGMNFMTVFNAWYYSFSPGIASTIVANNALRGIMKILLYPLIGILHLAASTYSLFGLNREFAVITSGLIASSLIGFIYIGPFALIICIAKKVRIRRIILQIGLLIWIVSLGGIVAAEIARWASMMRVSTAMFVLATMILATLSSIKYIARQIQH